MIHYLFDKNNFEKLKFLYTCRSDKYYEIAIKNFGAWDKIICQVMNNHFFRFEWVNKLNPQQVEAVAKFFEIEIKDWHESIHKERIVKGKMYSPDKRMHLHQNINKFVFKFNKANTKFKKTKVKF